MIAMTTHRHKGDRFPSFLMLLPFVLLVSFPQFSLAMSNSNQQPEVITSTLTFEVTTTSNGHTGTVAMTNTTTLHSTYYVTISESIGISVVITVATATCEGAACESLLGIPYVVLIIPIFLALILVAWFIAAWKTKRAIRLRSHYLKNFIRVAAVIMLATGFWLAGLWWFSRFPFSQGVTIPMIASLEKRIAMLRDFLVVLGIFTPLSALGFTIVLTSNSYRHVSLNLRRRAVLLGILSFFALIADIIIVLTYLFFSSFVSLEIPLLIYPLALVMLATGSALSLLALAEAAP